MSDRTGWRALLALAVSLGAGAGCEGTPRLEARAGEPENAAPRVHFETVKKSSSVVVGVLPASVIVPAEHRSTLGPPLEGRVVAWRVELGQQIEPGTPLIDLEVVGVADLEAALTEARELLAARSRTLALERQAASQGLSSASDVLAYEVGVAEARARRDALIGQLEARSGARSGPAEVKKNAGPGGGWTWTSSLSGVIERIECPRGQLARPEMSCLTVVDTSRAVVRIDLPERWLDRWPSGPIAGELTLTRGGVPLALTEVRRAPRIDEASRTLAVDFTTESKLLPGLSGRVALRAAVDGMAVPRAALTRLDGRDVVFVRSDAGGRPVPVELLGRDGADGDKVVVRPLTDTTLGEVATHGLFLLKSQHLMAGEAEQ